MKYFSIVIMLVTASLGFVACSSSEGIEQVTEEVKRGPLRVKVGLVSDADTRISMEDKGSTMLVKWTDTDQLFLFDRRKEAITAQELKYERADPENAEFSYFSTESAELFAPHTPLRAYVATTCTEANNELFFYLGHQSGIANDSETKYYDEEGMEYSRALPGLYTNFIATGDSIIQDRYGDGHINLKHRMNIVRIKCPKLEYEDEEFIEFELRSPEGNIPTQATFDLNQNVWRDVEMSNSIMAYRAVKSSTTNTYYVFLTMLPTEQPIENLTYTIRTVNRDANGYATRRYYTMTVPEGQIFEAGKKTLISMKNGAGTIY